MGFSWASQPREYIVGDQYEMLNGEAADLPECANGTVMTIYEVDEDSFGADARSPDGGEWYLNEQDLTHEYIKYIPKENEVGFKLEEDPQTGEIEAPTQNAEPVNWGGREYVQMVDAFTEASSGSNLTNRNLMLDGLNNRYRATAYRNHIKKMQHEGHITAMQINNMKSHLAGYRHIGRTPRSKSWRHQWP